MTEFEERLGVEEDAKYMTLDSRPFLNRGLFPMFDMLLEEVGPNAASLYYRRLSEHDRLCGPKCVGGV